MFASRCLRRFETSQGLVSGGLLDNTSTNKRALYHRYSLFRILQNNDISTLTNGTFRDLGQINNLYVESVKLLRISNAHIYRSELYLSALGQNPLHCDCDLRWLNVYFRSKYLDNGIALCSSPQAMNQKSVFHTNPANFDCSWATTASARYRRSDLSEAVTSKCSPCSSRPCHDHGICEALTGMEYRCRCDAPYFGENCEEKMDACFGKPCKNGGVCEVQDDLGHYRCMTVCS